jgi:predicted nucleotidyltransferase
MKYTGLDKIVEQVIGKLGNVEAVYLVGELAKGLDNPIIDLIFIGDINKTYLLNLTEKAEKIIHKKIRFVIFSEDEFKIQKSKILEQPHIEILN